MEHIFELRMKDQIEERFSQLLRNLSNLRKMVWYFSSREVLSSHLRLKFAVCGKVWFSFSNSIALDTAGLKSELL